MNQSAYPHLIELKKDAVIQFNEEFFNVALCPDMGARVFAEINGISPHRIDLETVKNPDKPFNNFGGANIWPAPEGGKFGLTITVTSGTSSLRSTINPSRSSNKNQIPQRCKKR